MNPGAHKLRIMCCTILSLILVFPYFFPYERHLRMQQHYNDIIIGTIASQITNLTTVYSTVYSDADQRKHQSSTLLAFVRGIHQGPVNSPHKWQVTRKMFPLDEFIMKCKKLHHKIDNPRQTRFDETEQKTRIGVYKLRWSTNIFLESKKWWGLLKISINV